MVFKIADGLKWVKIFPNKKPGVAAPGFLMK
jgi:hypothetical protein